MHCRASGRQSAASHCGAVEGAAGAETSAPFQPQLNFSSYSRSPAAVVEKPDDTKLIDAEEPSHSKGRR